MKLRLKYTTILLLFLFIIPLCSASSLPGDWWGKVTINSNSGNDGAIVDAYINGIKFASSTVGEYVSGYYLIHVEGKVGDFVYFKVNDIYVNEPPQPWSIGNHPQFDLTVNYCIPGEIETISCYTGPDGTQGVGICSAGEKTRICQEDFTWGEYSDCIGEILPQDEICDNFLDEDCDGQLNNGCECIISEKERECISNGFVEVTYGWNYDYCGQEYTETEQDSSCSCDYTEWTDDICIADGIMFQTRTETSGYGYCTAPLEQEVPDEICDCESSEVGRVCIDNGFAGVTYDWNYDYCGCSYTETVQDSLCLCNYTEWTDNVCIADGIIHQTRTETSGYGYCTDPLEQEVPNEICDCESSEIGRICIDDGFAEVTYGWNYAYCGQEYTETVQDSSCLCDYTDWQDETCIADGIMFQTRTEISGYGYCTDILEQEVPNELCDCHSEETGRICIDDGHAEVTYGWNYDYCGCSYTETVEDESCLCDYTDWQDDICVSDGMRRQIKYETTSFGYCDDELYNEIPDEECL